MPKVADNPALTCGLTLATKILLFASPSLFAIDTPSCEGTIGTSEKASSVLRTSVCDCNEMRTASADVTQPEHARQSVRLICAGGRFSGSTLSSVVTS